jgi:NAD(P)-dependent dehydrogenase (short-subunit alcohol dehydrogenase family)
MTALVTGTSRGIGRAVALRLAQDGRNLLLVGREAATLEQTAADARQRGVRAEIIVADLEAPHAPSEIAHAVTDRTGELEVLVNNAGLAPAGPIESYSLADWDRTMAVNARTPFFLTQALLPLLRRARPGYVVNICSVVSRKGYANQALYTASKHALLGFTKALAREVPTEELRVHAILPGGVDTRMIREVRPDIDPDELISADEIADLVAALVAMKGNAVVDEIEVRRRSKPAWD